MKIIYKDDVDAVITDVKMMEEDGMQFFEYIVENRSAKAPRLAALIDFMWGNRYSQDISVSIEPGFLLTPIRAVECKIATNLWVNATRKRRDLTEITFYTWITPEMGCYKTGE